MAEVNTKFSAFFSKFAMMFEMSKTKLVLATFIFLFVSYDAEAQNVNTNLVVTNLPAKKGSLIIAWYDNADEFTKPKKALYQHVVKTNGEGSVSTVFTNIPKGEYAIAMYFDENDNNKMDTNFLGIPIERYGFSNNKYFATRACTYEEAKFSIKQDNQKITVKLK